MLVGTLFAVFGAPFGLTVIALSLASSMSSLEAKSLSYPEKLADVMDSKLGSVMDDV